MAELAETTWRSLLGRRAADAGLSPLFGPLLEPPRAGDGCFVLGRIAQSLDGRIATPGGASRWIGGAGDIRHTHRLRALCDAVLVGAGTVRADDPALPTRMVEGPSPVRVVLDPARRLDTGYRVFQGGPPTLLICCHDAPQRRDANPGDAGPADTGPQAAGPQSAGLQAARPADPRPKDPRPKDRDGPDREGPDRAAPDAAAPAQRPLRMRPGLAEVLMLPAGPAGLEITALLALLAGRGLRRILVEGGGLTLSRFLAAGALDRLHVTIAPLLLGAGIPAFTLPAPASPDQGLRLTWQAHDLGTDLLLDIPLHRVRPASCG